MKSLRIVVLGINLSAAALLTGCATSPVLPRVHESLKASPQAYNSIRAMPIDLELRGTLDKTLTLDDLRKVAPLVGTNLCEALTQELTQKGYQVVPPMRAYCFDEEWEQLDSDTRQLTHDVYEEFDHVSASIAKNLTKEKSQPFLYKMGTQIDDLEKRLGAQDANAILLVETLAVLESKARANGRNTLNVFLVLGGAGYLESPSRTIYRIALVDAHTHEVLWWNQLGFAETNVRSRGDMQRTIKRTLAGLPAVKPATEGAP